MSASVGTRAQSAGAGATQDSGAVDQEPPWSLRASAATWVSSLTMTTTSSRLWPSTAGRCTSKDVTTTRTADRCRVSSDGTSFRKDGHASADADVRRRQRRHQRNLPAWSWILSGDASSCIRRAIRNRRRPPQDRFLYNWSEVSMWATSGSGPGLSHNGRAPTARRRHPARPPRGRDGVEGRAGVYFFNPGSRRPLFVASIGVEF